MPTYLTPGVYYERVDAAPAISAIRTDIAGFVGIATRGPLHTAVPVQSWRQYVAYFGDFTGVGYLAYAVRGFFENGGRRCWVVRVAAPPDEVGGANTAAVTLQALDGHDAWQIAAYSPGVWGNNLDVTLTETHGIQTITTGSESTEEYFSVAATGGFTRATHVRLSQNGNAVYRVVAEVNPIRRWLYWVHPKPEARLLYDQPVTSFNLTQPILVESIEYTLQVRERGRLVRVYEGLSCVPEHRRYAPTVLSPLRIERRGRPSQTLPAVPEPVVIHPLLDLATLAGSELLPLQVAAISRQPLRGGTEGLLTLRLADFTGEPFDPLDSDEVRQRKQRGLQALDDVSEVAILAVPDIHIQPVAISEKAPLPVCIPDPCLPPGPPPPATPRPLLGDELPPIFGENAIYQVQAAQIAQCERRRDRIALLEPPYSVAGNEAQGFSGLLAWRNRFDSKYAAFYYPWLRVLDPLRTPALTRDIPPSGHIAGQYALTDAQAGVHKAPANSALGWVQDVTVFVNDAHHAGLNPIGINLLRTWPNRGIRIFGARTVSSDPDWRYVNVRRLLMMIEKGIDLSTQWATFEPNNFVTRTKLRLALSTFLLTLWQQGALMGGSAAEAFFVKCDDENNPPALRDQGQLLVEVGVAPSKPFEFVVLRVGRTDNEFEVSEATLLQGGF